MTSITVYSKPHLGFPGGLVNHFSGTAKDARAWLTAKGYLNNARYEIVRD